MFQLGECVENDPTKGNVCNISNSFVVLEKSSSQIEDSLHKDSYPRTHPYLRP